MRRHVRGGRHRRRGGAGQRRLLAGRARPLRRRRAGDRLAPSPRARQRRRRRRAAPPPARRSTTSSSSPSPRGPGSSARCSSAWPRRRGSPPRGGCRSRPVDHLQGHVAANFLAPDPIEPPFLCLIASGGHTLLVRVDDHRGFEVIGGTLDDAAGEAFDKGARLLGLGYPGGPALSRLAAERRPDGVRVPHRRARARASTSRSPASRRRCSTPCATWGRRRPRAAPPTSPPPTSTRSSRR